MDDLISRSALLDDVRQTIEASGCVNHEGEMLDCIRYAPAVDAGPMWISVEDRLPDSQSDVLVVAFWHECWQPMIGWHSDSGEKWRVLTPHGEQEPGGVTHWMPMPEPPKEE